MEKIFKVADSDLLQELFGDFDANVKMIEGRYDVSIFADGSDVLVRSENEAHIAKVMVVLQTLVKEILKGEKIDSQKLEYCFHLVEEEDTVAFETFNRDIIVMTARGKAIKAKTRGQQEYFETILTHDVVFGIGPAGTGKTYLAVAMAVRAFKNKEVSRIVITRPAVEAGESLGFLPGDLQMKVDPYLRPLYDALYDILGAETYLKLKERGLIEVAPLAYMRGRTLDNSFIILDEAQNTTREQMKMFLTRFGFGSKVVVNGDVTQIDLPGKKPSGLLHAAEVLGEIPGIAFVHFSHRDVVRHALVKKIIASYEKYERNQVKNNGNTHQ
ncbi:MAG: phosphate starvation-inducible protein PhoH [delta proteobacterium ML8_F1]|nr:MAG: phosphate starvation-inducible protein PhoH [delta proteobacterium ML8_F1]